MTRPHPLLKIALNDDGRLSWPMLPGQTQRCPTCMRNVMTDPDGNLVHQMEEGINPCTPSVDVVISKAIIELLATGERLYVNPVKNSNRTLVPPFIFLHKDKQLRPFINTDYQPAGATWRSEKGNRLGLFYMNERASKINKDQFDFIAVIDPSIFMAEFEIFWAMDEFDNPLTALQYSLITENMSSVWVKWPVKSLQPKKETEKSDYWYDYYSPLYPVHQAACTATVFGIEGNNFGETVYMVQVAIHRSIVEYQLVKSLGVILLLDNTGNLVSDTHPYFDIIIKACISGVRDFVRQNPRMRSVEHQMASAMPR